MTRPCRLFSLALPLLLGACGPRGTQTEPPASAGSAADLPADPALADPGASMPDPASLDWSMALESGGLRIRYAVTNTSKTTFYLCDQMPIPGKETFVLGTDFINVAGGTASGTVRFVRGRLASIVPVPIPLDPGARSVKPGETVHGEALVPLPLAPAHYHGRSPPLDGTPTSAVLELGYVRADAHWTELALDDGGKLTTPLPMDEMRTLRSSSQPIPTTP